jgi:hypothetical protein
MGHRGALTLSDLATRSDWNFHRAVFLYYLSGRRTRKRRRHRSYQQHRQPQPQLATRLATCLLGGSKPRHTVRRFGNPTLDGHGWYRPGSGYALGAVSDEDWDGTGPGVSPVVGLGPELGTGPALGGGPELGAGPGLGGVP